MANNASDLADQSICGSAVEEEYVPAISDGALLPGSGCSVTTGTGVIVGTQAAVTEEFVGILEKSYNKTIDEFQVSGKAISLVKPQFNKRYLMRIDSGNTGAGIAGKPLEWSTATAFGELMDGLTLDDKHVATLDQDFNGSDDFAWVRWTVN